MASNDETNPTPLTTEEKKGPLAYMVSNSVAANLLMLGLIIGGLMLCFQMKQEVFPEFELDVVNITVAYPGSSPAEIENAIILSIEEAVTGIDGVKEITSVASEGSGSVNVELETDAIPTKVAAEIRNSVDRITSFPEDAERPVIALASRRREVIELHVHGYQDEEVLRQVSEQLRDQLLLHSEITQVELEGIRPREIQIEIPQETLRKYNLTLDRVAQQIRAAAVELPGGSVKTKAGEILLRTDERRDLAHEFENLAVVTNSDGVRVQLSEIAEIKDGFQDVDEATYFNGRPSVRVSVYRVGDQTPVGVADAAIESLEAFRPQLPPGVEVDLWKDDSQVYKARIDLLLRNAGQGLILVLLVLGLFLDLRLAFWVTLGIPISFLGSFFALSFAGVSINMVSLFAYIITLGIVVDDAIVVGENIFERRVEGDNAFVAAVRGVQQVAGPVTFSILTTVAAFIPMLFLPGFTGKIFKVIPVVVISVLLVSLVESLFVLPAHLAHSKKEKNWFFEIIDFIPTHVGAALAWAIANVYQPVLRKVVSWRYTTLAVGIVILLLSLTPIKTRYLNFTFMPKIESDRVTADVELQFGVNKAQTVAVQAQIVEAAKQCIREFGEDKAIGIVTQLGKKLGRPGGGSARASTGGHIASVQVRLVSSDEREFSAFEFTKRWRELVPQPANVSALTFSATTGPSGSIALDVQLSHRKVEVLENAARDLANALRKYKGTKEVDEGFGRGKPQYNFKITPAAQTLGLNATALGRQVRNAFYGIEAFRQQRGRDEVKVLVSYPETDRESEYNLEQMLIRTDSGGEIPLHEAAEIDRDFSYTSILRIDGRRSLHVTCDVIKKVTTGSQLQDSVVKDVLPLLRAKYPALTISFSGDAKSRNEAMGVLQFGMILALIAIYGLLAIPFQSYIQPAIVMSAIPFGIVGAIGGHLLLGYDISVISMMGIVALMGIVVNDSLILIDSANAFSASGYSNYEAIIAAGMRRLRPIILTSLTTFFGLMPMISEKSLQARFLIPMAISLGFGVLFATFIILLLVPALYMIIEDIKWLAYWLYGIGGDDHQHSDMLASSPEPQAQEVVRSAADSET